MTSERCAGLSHQGQLQARFKLSSVPPHHVIPVHRQDQSVCYRFSLSSETSTSIRLVRLSKLWELTPAVEGPSAVAVTLRRGVRTPVSDGPRSAGLTPPMASEEGAAYRADRPSSAARTLHRSLIVLSSEQAVSAVMMLLPVPTRTPSPRCQHRLRSASCTRPSWQVAAAWPRERSCAVYASAHPTSRHLSLPRHPAGQQLG